jgi:RimJ/RimL family protein N-acetyltransferase
VRSWSEGDTAALVRHANDRDIWLNLRDRFPHPYTEADARAFLRASIAARPTTNFAIDVGGEAIGAIGLVLGQDVERVSAEVGYWVSRHFQGRGIATAALVTFTAWAWDAFALTRIFALPFLRNEASCRVLEKAGYERECVLRKSAIKDGVLLDQVLYAVTRE